MFLAPWFLLGVLGIALPLWLHRIVRENRTRQAFASSMLLEASQTQRTAQRQLRYWVLLALRIALLVILALAFAQPLLPSRAAAELARPQLQAIVIDSSLSMQSGGRWQSALDAARTLLENTRSPDRVMLVSASGDRMQILGGPVAASDAGTLRAALGSLQPGAARLDYGLLMRTAGSWLGNSNGASEQTITLHLITDLQRSGGPLRFADLQPPAATRLQLHEVAGTAVSGNAWIERLGLSSQDSRQVRVRAAGNLAPGREAVLFIDGRERERRPLLQAELLFAPQRLSAGMHRVEVRLSPADELPQDDARFAVIRAGDVAVLLLAADPNGDDAAYFSAAVASVNRPRLRVLRATPQTLAPGAFDSPAMIVVSDTGLLSTGAVTRLRERLQAGGTVLATLGPRAVSRGSDPLSGLALRNAGSATVRVGSVDDSHPVLREAQDWRAARFFRHLLLTPAADDKVLIALEDGAPLLLERRYGNGRLLLLTAPLDRDWNDLAIYPLFVRFISDAARYLSGDAQSPDALVGTPFAAGLTGTSEGQIFDPEGRPALSLSATGTAARVLPASPGFYEIRGNEQTRWLAVNVDPRESDLSPLDAAAVARWQALRPRVAARSNAASGDVPAAPVSVGRWLLWGLAALALAELLFANRHLRVRREVAQ
ncbi:MAG: BatA and WFA domain-containing protein [Steroidobacteraceae bacterium]